MIEFIYKDKVVQRIESSMTMPIGGIISILGKFYEIYFVSFSLDYADDCQRKRMRCDVYIKKAKFKRKAVKDE